MSYPQENQDPVLASQAHIDKISARTLISQSKESASEPISTNDVVSDERLLNKLRKFSCPSNSEIIHTHQHINEEDILELYNRIPIVVMFRKFWGTEGYILPEICSLNNRPSMCEPCSFGFGNKCEDFTHSNEFIIPACMPFMVTRSPVFGISYVTPFFTFLPKLMSKIPKPLFALNSLTFENVENFIAYRHGLAYNHMLKIEIPNSFFNALNDNTFWMELIIECSELLKNPVVHAPVVLLPNILKAMKTLLLTIIPDRMNDIYFYLAPERLLEPDTEAHLHNMLQFLLQTLHECVEPSKIKWVYEAQRCFEEAGNAEKLVTGLKIAIELFTCDKIMTINRKISKNLQSMLDTTVVVERRYYDTAVITGKISKHDFIDWLMKWKPCGQAHTNLACELQISSALMTSMISRENRIVVPKFFDLDKKTIKELQCCFDDMLLENINNELDNCPQFRTGLVDALESQHIFETHFGKLVESRLVDQINRLVEENLTIQKLNPKLTTPIEYFAHKLATLVSLHFAGARPYYL